MSDLTAAHSESHVHAERMCVEMEGADTAVILAAPTAVHPKGCPDATCYATERERRYRSARVIVRTNSEAGSALLASGKHAFESPGESTEDSSISGGPSWWALSHPPTQAQGAAIDRAACSPNDEQAAEADEPADSG